MWKRENTRGAKCKQVMNLVGKYSLYFCNSYNFPIRLNFFKTIFLKHDKKKNIRKLEWKATFLIACEAGELHSPGDSSLD